MQLLVQRLLLLRLLHLRCLLLRLLLLLLLLLLLASCRLLLCSLAGLQQVAFPAARLVAHWFWLAHPPRLLMRVHGTQHRPHMAAPVDAAGKRAAHAAPAAVHVFVQQRQAAPRGGRGHA